MTEEDRLQESCVKWFRLQYPKFNGALFAIPNGGGRSIGQARVLKRTGVWPGVPDLGLLLPNGGMLWIELKTPKGRLGPDQKAWFEMANTLGHDIIVVRSLEGFMEIVKSYFVQK